MTRPRTLLTTGGLIATNLVVIALAIAGPFQPHSNTSDRAKPSPATPTNDTHRPIEGPVALAIDDDGRILRATQGSCVTGDRPAAVWLASPNKAPARVNVPGLRQTWTAMVQDGQFVLVGSGPDCSVRAYSSTEGTAWKRTAIPDVWYAATINGNTRVMRGGRRDSIPEYCAPVGVSSRVGEAFVSCASGSIMQIEPENLTPPWPMVGVGPLTMPAPDIGWALTSEPGCGARVYRMLPDQSDWTGLTCFGNDALPMGIAASARLVAAQIGEELMVSTDQGQTWSPR